MNTNLSNPPQANQNSSQDLLEELLDLINNYDITQMKMIYENTNEHEIIPSKEVNECQDALPVEFAHNYRTTPEKKLDICTPVNSQSPASTMSMDELQLLEESATQHHTHTRAGLPPEDLQLPGAELPTTALKKYKFSGAPDRYDFPGNFEFEVRIGRDYINYYLPESNTVLVKRNKNIPFGFAWKYGTAPERMRIRATIVFSLTEDATRRVETCEQHKNAKEEIAKHVMLSCSDFGTEGVDYCGEADKADSWLSVAVALERSNPGMCSHAYKFVCNNSCPSGIGRRPTSVIFTLETLDGVVHGQQTIGVKICASPGRDMRGVGKKIGKKHVKAKQTTLRNFKKNKLEIILTKLDAIIGFSKELNSKATHLRSMVKDAMSQQD